MKIKEGYVHDITCPAFGCTKLVLLQIFTCEDKGGLCP